MSVTGVTGNLLIFQRIVTASAFKLLRLAFTAVQGVYWQLNGTAKKIREAREPKNYERSAQVLNVILFHKFCRLHANWFTDFICTHNRFEDPQYIIDNDHITLMTITDENAVFAVAPEKGMHLWKSEFSPFIRVAIGEYCTELIVVPLNVFHRMAETIGDLKADIIFMFNTARCGSTLLTQVMEYTGRCVTFSEPDGTNLIASKYRTEGDSPEIRQLARDVLRWQCRPFPSLQPPPLAYLLKIIAPAAAAYPLFKNLYPKSRCLFMYRDVVPVAKSLYRMSAVLPSMRLAIILGQLSGSMTAAIIDSTGMHGEDFRFRLESDLGFGVLVTAITMKAYLDMREEGFNVSAIRYEDLVARPLESCRRILKYCGLPVSLAELAVKGFEKDSQRNSLIAKHIIGKIKEPELTTKSKAALDELMKKFGLPPLGEEIILEGTITSDK